MKPSMLAVGAICLFALPARAGEVQTAAKRVEAEWRRAGAEVTLLSPRFLFDDETFRFPLPDEKSALPCTTIALVGSRGLSFHAKVVGASDDPLLESPLRASSLAGVLEVSTCDEEDRPAGIQVTDDAGRGAIEVVVARSRSPLARVHAILLERVGGTLPAPQDPGPLGALPTPDKRGDLAEARARNDRADIQPRRSAQATAEGSGEIELDLFEGCHRI